MIIQRYVMREITKPLVAVGAALLIIFASFTAARYLAKVVEGLLPTSAVVPLTLLKSAIALDMLLPIALHLSVVVALGRLYTNSEMTALFACGVSPMHVLRAIAWLSLLVAAVVAALSWYVRPWAFDKSYRLKNLAVADFDISKLEAGRFYETQLGHRVMFVDKLDRETNRMQGVFIQTEHGDTVRVISAKEAYHDVSGANGAGELVCLDAHVYELARNGEQTTIGQIEVLRLQLLQSEAPPLGYKRKAASTIELAGSDSLKDNAEFQWRLSTALSAFILGLLGFPLSRAEARKGKYAKLVLAVLVYTAYYYTTLVARTWVEQGIMPGLWWVHALLACVVLAAIFKPDWASWMRRRLQGHRVPSQA